MADHNVNGSTEDGDIWANLDAIANQEREATDELSEGGRHHEDEDGSEEEHLEEIIDVQPRVKKNPLPIYAAAAALGLAGLGVGGYLLMDIFGLTKTSPKTAISTQVMGVSQKSAGNSLPGGSVSTSKPGGSNVVGIEQPDIAAGVPQAVPSAPVVVASAAAPVAPAVAPVAAAVETQRTVAVVSQPVAPGFVPPATAPAPAPAVAAQPSSVQRPTLTAAVPMFAIKNAAPADPVLTAKAQPSEEIIESKPAKSSVRASRPAAARPEAVQPRSSRSATHRAARAKTKKIEAEETILADLPVLTTFKILAFLPDSGEYQMAYVREVRTQRSLVVREGDSLPDGSVIRKIDARSWVVATNSGVVR